MPALTIARADGGIPRARPYWDSIWQGDLTLGTGGYADWDFEPARNVGVADADIVPDPNAGGLLASARLDTAILLCLFTDRRLPPDSDASAHDGDRRGWAGDTIDIAKAEGERDLGSLLWTLERAPLTFETERLVEQYAREALQTLIDQGALSALEVEATALPEKGRLALHVRARSPSGAILFDNAFAVR